MKIVILGGGTAGWMAANLFIKKWYSIGAEITLIESPDVGIIGVGEGSTPTLKRFFDLIEVEESEWMPQCNATYKLNIKFSGWSPESGIAEYSHPFISQLDTFTERAFIVNGQTRRLGLDVNTTPEDFLINGYLAKQGKGPNRPEHFPFRMEYGYHFDSHLLGQFLAELAVERGVKHKQAKVVHVENHEDGSIKTLNTESGEKISADLFVDCTGFASLLMQKNLQVKFNSFKQNLFNDSAVVLPTALPKNIPVETVSTALSHGWCWQIPLTNRFGNGYVYASDYINEDDAETELRQHLGLLESDVEARHLKMRVGQLEKHWHKNCLAIGLSQGFIEPLEATALHLVQVCIELFMSKFEEGQFSNKHQNEFNQKIVDRFERVRDYIVAHYKLNTRNDSEYWKANRENKHFSDSLFHILDVWFRRGDIAQEIQRQKLTTHFDTVSWNCLLAGYGAFPDLEPNQPGTGDLYKEQKIQSFLSGCALNFSSHQSNLDQLIR